MDRRSVRPRLALSFLLAVVMTLSLVSVASAGHAKKRHRADVKLQLLAINDFHGQIVPYSTTLGGAALLGGYLDAREAQAKSVHESTVRLGVGDLIGASPPASGLLGDEPTLKVLDVMKFKYSAIGNHEFDRGGLAGLLRLQHGGFSLVSGRWKPLHMQYLAANAVREKSGRPILPPYVIKNVGGIRVGIIGAVYQGTPTITMPSQVAGIRFLNEAQTVNKYVARLKARGVKTIIVLLHNGGTGDVNGGPITGDVVSTIEAIDDEVDVVLTAHSHTRYWGSVGGKLVTQAYSAGRAFADVDLVLSGKTGDVVSKTAEIVSVTATTGVVPNAKVAKIVAAAEAEVAPLTSRVVGTAASDISRTLNAAGESQLGNLLADAQRWKGATQIAVVNPGAMRSDIFAGEVTWGELFSVQPFANYLVTLKLTGAQIDDLLERQWLGQSTPRMLQLSGITYGWSASAPVGSKVDPANVMIGGAPLDLGATYTVSTNSFLAVGGDLFTTFTGATDPVNVSTDLDALVEYIGSVPQPFSAVVDGRVNVLP